MLAILIRARRSNYDLGERETRYLTWIDEILNKDDIIDKDDDYARCKNLSKRKPAKATHIKRYAKVV